MPKRSAKELIEQYEFKIRKLREKERPRRRLVILSSSDDEDSSESANFLENQTEQTAPENTSQPTGNGTDQEVTPVGQPACPAAAPDAPAQDSEAAVLDPELLTALGDATDESPKFGGKIHEKLASLWLPLLRKGLSKESKDFFLKEYLIPENCPLLQAPRLNAEISAAVTEATRNRDKKLETAQQQLGAGITAVNRAMTILLTSDDKVKAIKILSDSCRILSDLHFCDTQARTKMITPGLAKPFLTIIQDTERDELLFGNKLPEKFKASKAIEKQGLQIKKPVPVTKNTATPSTSTAARSNHQYQGNWSGPSRYTSNKGGRGGQKKAVTARKPPPAPASRPAGQGKPRANPQQ